MRILFTGASSFTGYWFIKELANAGHQVTAVFQGEQHTYTETRKQRVNQLTLLCQPVFNCSFGSPKFLEVIQSQNSWDILCHHAADVTDYKSQDFDIAKAVRNNTHNLNAVLDALKEKGCRKVVITGSVFEQNEGAGPDLWKAFSPYGLSKGFTADVIRYYANQKGMYMGKFVIPNPFGPYEESRFTTYLIQNWIAEKVAVVNTPAYVRDNIPVTLLAKAYVYFICHQKNELLSYKRINPSGYVESQGDFTQRFARAMQARLNLTCAIELKEQTDFSEPITRINTDLAKTLPVDWDEEAAWDELADYYRTTYQKTSVEAS